MLKHVKKQKQKHFAIVFYTRKENTVIRQNKNEGVVVTWVVGFSISSSKLIIYIRLVYSQYNKALITQKAKFELKPNNKNGHGLP